MEKTIYSSFLKISLAMDFNGPDLFPTYSCGNPYLVFILFLTNIMEHS